MRASTFTSSGACLLLVLAFGLAACGGSSRSAASARSLPVPMSSFARAMLADGRVTRAEHERALAATVACAKAAGLQVDVNRKTDRVIEIGFGSGAYLPGESDAAYTKRFDAAMDQCNHEYWDDIDTVFLRDSAPSEQQRADALAQLSACEVRNGEKPVRNEADYTQLMTRIAQVDQSRPAQYDGSDPHWARVDAQMNCVSVYEYAVATSG